MQPFRAAPVQAIAYEPPTVAEDGTVVDNTGNYAEFAAIVPTRGQVPWDPANGQNCILVELANGTYVVTPGSYLVQHANGDFTVIDAEDFAVTYSASKSSARSDTGASTA